jgi:hypothetical protein
MVGRMIAIGADARISMKHHPFYPLLALIALAAANMNVAQAKSAPPLSTPDEKRAQLSWLVFQTVIDTEGLPAEMTLAKLLAALEARLPAGKKIALRIDEKAFGKEFRRVADARVKIGPPFKAPLGTFLNRALGHVGRDLKALDGLDFAIQPTGVEITRPQFAAHRVVYDVRDIVPHLPALRANLKQFAESSGTEFDPVAGPGLLPAFLLCLVDLRSWETVHLLNRTRLVVVASPSRHEDIASLLNALRRLLDVAVVINARLYEVDRAFYARNVAPLFARYKDPDERPRVLPIDGPLLKQIIRQKLVLESEDVKLRPNRTVAFLSRQKALRFSRGSGKEGRPRIGTALTGVSFEVEPAISLDRRFLRLKVTQKVAQFVRIDKTITLDVTTGKDVEVESPNLRRTTQTGMVEIPDANPILMPVDYRPADKGSADKVWLLVARPFIWIEEEMTEIRKGGGDLSLKGIWNADVVKEEPGPAPRFR